jgi:hypothetical protein
MRAGQKSKIVVAFVVILLLAGCLDMTMTATVDEEGEIDRIRLELEMDETTYAMALEEAGEDCFDSVSEAFAREIQEEEPGIDGATEHEDRFEDDVVIVEVTFEDVTVEEISGVATELTDEETVVFTDATLDEIAEEGEEGEFVYRIEMPGEIVKTNADEVEEGNTVAVWYPDETATETAYVESEIDDGFSLVTIALALGLLGVAMVGLALYQGVRE